LAEFGGELAYIMTCDVSQFQQAIQRARASTERMQQTFRVLHGDFVKVDSQTRAMQRGFRDLGSQFAFVGGLITNLSIMSFVLHLMWTRLETSQERIRDAQERYNRAVARYGPASERARSALRDHELAHRALQRAQMEHQIQMALFSVQMATLTARTITQIAAMLALRAATQAAIAGMVAPLAGIAVGVGAYAAFRLLAPRIEIESEPEINIKTELRRTDYRRISGVG